MSVIDAYISWSEGRFFIHTPSDVGVSVIGKTVSEAKRLFEEFVSEYRSDCIEAGASVPEELRGDYAISYNYEMSALLQELPVTLRALSQVTGLNQRQLSAYKNGLKTPRKATGEKILHGIKEIGNTLQSVTLR